MFVSHGFYPPDVDKSSVAALSRSADAGLRISRSGLKGLYTDVPQHTISYMDMSDVLLIG